MSEQILIDLNDVIEHGTTTRGINGSGNAYIPNGREHAGKKIRYFVMKEE